MKSRRVTMDPRLWDDEPSGERMRENVPVRRMRPVKSGRHPAQKRRRPSRKGSVRP